MITAPGAPLSGLAPPFSTPPSPSPNHHTPIDQAIDAARAMPDGRAERDAKAEQELDRGEERC